MYTSKYQIEERVVKGQKVLNIEHPMQIAIPNEVEYTVITPTYVRHRPSKISFNAETGEEEIVPIEKPYEFDNHSYFFGKGQDKPKMSVSEAHSLNSEHSDSIAIMMGNSVIILSHHTALRVADAITKKTRRDDTIPKTNLDDESIDFPAEMVVIMSLMQSDDNKVSTKVLHDRGMVSRTITAIFDRLVEKGILVDTGHRQSYYKLYAGAYSKDVMEDEIRKLGKKEA